MLSYGIFCLVVLAIYIYQGHHPTLINNIARNWIFGKKGKKALIKKMTRMRDSFLKKKTTVFTGSPSKSSTHKLKKMHSPGLEAEMSDIIDEEDNKNPFEEHSSDSDSSLDDSQ